MVTLITQTLPGQAVVPSGHGFYSCEQMKPELCMDDPKHDSRHRGKSHTTSYACGWKDTGQSYRQVSRFTGHRAREASMVRKSGISAGTAQKGRVRNGQLHRAMCLLEGPSQMGQVSTSGKAEHTSISSVL